jgi:hypothetical protein
MSKWANFAISKAEAQSNYVKERKKTVQKDGWILHCTANIIYQRLTGWWKNIKRKERIRE